MVSIYMQTPAARASFIEELTKVNRKLRTLFDARVKSQGLTHSRARLLMYLAKNEGATQVELAAAMEMEQPSMVTLIDGLEKKGFVTRQPLERDRRANGIFLTAKARKEADDIIAFANHLREQVLTGIEKSELELATKVLRQVGRNIDTSA